MTTLGCREAVQRLWAYLDEDLDTLDHAAVEAHLQFCLRCCGELAFAREVRAVLAHSQPALPPGAHERLEAFIDRLDVPRSAADVGDSP